MPWAGGNYTKGNSATGGWTGDASLGIGIEAGRHDTQDNDFATGINQCLNKDGSNAATGPLNLGGNKLINVANGTTLTDAATFGQLSSIIPSGAITAYGGASAPTGWLLCNGASQPTASYPALHAVIGYTYGGSGANFNLPNLQQRFPLGKAASGTGATLGGTGGAIDHTHTSAAHTHTIASHAHTLSNAGAAKITGGGSPSDTIMERVSTATWTANLTTSPDVPWAAPGTAPTISQGAGLIGSTDSTALTTDSTTPGATGANNPPFLVVNYIIKT
jgi:microcystin-dependent protein